MVTAVSSQFRMLLGHLLFDTCARLSAQAADDRSGR
jgi:hypothetical protein